MRVLIVCLALTAVMLLGAGTGLANPALMRKNIPGYPYPGTAAVEHFGSRALSEAVRRENKEETGVVSGTITLGDNIRGKSLLPPRDDPKQLSPFAGAQQPGAAMLKSPL